MRCYPTAAPHANYQGRQCFLLGLNTAEERNRTRRIYKQAANGEDSRQATEHYDQRDGWGCCNSPWIPFKHWRKHLKKIVLSFTFRRNWVVKSRIYTVKCPPFHWIRQHFISFSYASEVVIVSFFDGFPCLFPFVWMMFQDRCFMSFFDLSLCSFVSDVAKSKNCIMILILPIFDSSNLWDQVFSAWGILLTVTLHLLIPLTTLSYLPVP